MTTLRSSVQVVELRSGSRVFIAMFFLPSIEDFDMPAYVVLSMFYQAQIAGGKKTRPALVFQEKHAKSLFLFNQDNLSFYSYIPSTTAQ